VRLVESARFSLKAPCIVSESPQEASLFGQEMVDVFDVG